MNDTAEAKLSQRRGCWRLSRRNFLIGAATAGAGLLLGWRFGLPALRLQMAQMFDGAESGSSGFGEVDARPTAWFAITPDNQVTITIPKIEMGQGIHTALAQIAADELDCDWAQLRVELANTSDGPNDSFGTAGSMSVTSLWTPLREAAATMRQMLLNAAAVQLAVPAGQLIAHNGTISAPADPAKTLSFGEVVASHEGEWEVPEETPRLKSVDQFRYIGQRMPRVDLYEKLTGRARYGFDMRLEGMLYGAVAYPNTIGGQITAAAPGNAGNEPGVVTVVTDNDFAGIVAETRVSAERALSKLDLQIDDGPPINMEDIRQTVTVGNGASTIIQRDGDAVDALEGDAVVQTHLAEYRTPLAAHAHLEPQAAVVAVNDDLVEAWVSTQMPGLVQESLAEALGRELEEIKVHSTYIGGGFGRKAGTEAAVEAALLSRAAGGRPVHVGWNRAKEFRNGYLRPPTHHILKGGLDATGRILALDHQQASADVAFLFMPAFFPILAGADFGATRGAQLTYDVANVRTVAWRTQLPLTTGWWRGLGLLANIFAIESFVDELAHLAGADPLAFRLNHLPPNYLGERLRGVLERVAEMADWGSSLPDGHAHGLAVAADAGTMVAQIAEVSLEAGKPRVHQVHCAIDPGLPINPDGVIAQTQGAIIMGLGSTLFEEITIEDGRIANSNFDSYRLMTLKETPAIAVDVIRSGDQPFGMGEPPIGPIAAAVANGLFAATGQRIRELPLRP